jgi:hypothetical protein
VVFVLMYEFGLECGFVCTDRQNFIKEHGSLDKADDVLFNQARTLGTVTLM